MFIFIFFFFFQAEDGIRDRLVTGVQTCALPIFNGLAGILIARRAVGLRGSLSHAEQKAFYNSLDSILLDLSVDYVDKQATLNEKRFTQKQIGRASCRERV